MTTSPLGCTVGRRALTPFTRSSRREGRRCPWLDGDHTIPQKGGRQGRAQQAGGIGKGKLDAGLPVGRSFFPPERRAAAVVLGKDLLIALGVWGSLSGAAGAQ